ncbi:MAG: c-type cytochrome [Pseudomonas sp.]
MTVKKLLTASAAMLVLVAGGAFASAVENAIAERIKPYGSVCLAGDPCAEDLGGAVAAAGGEGGAARSGEAVYKQFCTACHGPGILGAPATGDDAVWAERLTAAGSLEALTTSAINGIGAMPPRGTCADCSDEEILESIKFMSGLE